MIKGRMIMNKKYCCGFYFLLFIVLSHICTLAQSGAYTLNGGTAEKISETLTSAVTDVSAVLVKNSGVLTLTTCTISTTGNSSSTDNSSKVGLNAVILANASGRVIMNGGSITSIGSGANGLFATGTGSSISMSNGTITCSGGNAHGIDVTYTGSIYLNNVVIKTTGGSSSGVATDFGGGTIVMTGGSVSVSGSKSAGIYSTGDITVNNASVEATGDNGAVIDADGIIKLNNTALTGSQNGLMVHNTVGQSSLTANFTITGGSLTAHGGDAFYVTGAKANITINNSAIISASTGKIVDAVSTSTVVFKVDAAALTGKLVTDAASVLNAVFQNGASLNGSVNNSNTASSISLSLDASSSLNLTGDCYVTVFTNSGAISGSSVSNVTGNGYNIYYNSSASGNSYLGARTYNLNNGGKLLPLGSVKIGNETENMPEEFFLHQNYPNPFNPETTIKYKIPSGCFVRLTVYDLQGREVSALVNEWQGAGTYSVPFKGIGLSSGIYYYRLIAGAVNGIKKMILIK
jgi:hypothetical protein